MTTFDVRERMDTEGSVKEFGYMGHRVKLIIDFSPQGAVSQLRTKMEPHGTTEEMVSAFMNAVSIGLKHGAPLLTYVNGFSGMEISPNGFATNPQIIIARSIIDYIFRYLGQRFFKLKFEKECSDCGEQMIYVAEGHACPKCDSWQIEHFLKKARG